MKSMEMLTDRPTVSDRAAAAHWTEKWCSVAGIIIIIIIIIFHWGAFLLFGASIFHPYSFKISSHKKSPPSLIATWSHHRKEVWVCQAAKKYRVKTFMFCLRYVQPILLSKSGSNVGIWMRANVLKVSHHVNKVPDITIMLLRHYL